MAKYLIEGGKRLCGEVRVQRAKNSVLALIAASVLIKGQIRIAECPMISDVVTMVKILRAIGARCEFSSGALDLDCSDIYSTDLPEKLTAKVRSSFFLTGALVSRFKTASLSRPGGCNIGARPIDIHLEGLSALGAEWGESEKRLNFFATRLKGATIRLRYPSVGATENLMMASTLADGVTVLKNCAKEPEIKDLQDLLNACGAKIYGAGTDRIVIYGVEKLHGGVEFTPICDRIEAGTFLLAALAVGGEVSVKGVKYENILPLAEKIKNNTCKLYVDNDNINIRANGTPVGFGNVVTAPFPLFPTDLMPQLCAAAAVSCGRTVVTETVFDDRFRFSSELTKMGADITVAGDVAVIEGKKLYGAEISAADLRGGAALAIAAMAAEGRSVLWGVEHLERGYEDFSEKLKRLGADVERK